MPVLKESPRNPAGRSSAKPIELEVSFLVRVGRDVRRSPRRFRIAGQGLRIGRIVRPPNKEKSNEICHFSRIGRVMMAP